MTTEEFLRDVCPNHTDTSKWNKSELLYILELHTEQLRKHDVVRQSEQLFCNMAGEGFCPYEGKDGKCTMLDKCLNHTTE